MNPLFSRSITITSAILLIYEMIKGELSISLGASNFIDLMIIIAAMCGLFSGILILETPIGDSDSTDAATSLAEITPSDRTRTDKESKNEGD